MQWKAQGPQGMATKKPAGMGSNPAERGLGKRGRTVSTDGICHAPKADRCHQPRRCLGWDERRFTLPLGLDRSTIVDAM